MVKKLLSFLIFFVVLTGFAQTAAFADGNAAKLGIENGDTVVFGGKSGAPIRWRVIDAEKSNTGDKNGVLLLSRDNLINIKSPTKSTDWTADACGTFYDEQISGYDRNAVMTVSKTDEKYSYGGYSFTGSLPEGTGVFALSAPELNSLSSDLKRFDGSENWYLRSVVNAALFLYSYADSTGKFNFKSSAIDPRNNLKIRPAVNLDKSKLASIDGKPILLPVGDFSDAKGRFVPVGTANEWKFGIIGEVKLKSAFSNQNTENGLTLNVEKSTSSLGYISAIIVKADGTISHYAKYQINGYTLKQPVTLPSDINAETDSLYVFHESHDTNNSGASRPVRICLKHSYEHSSFDGTSHKVTCTECGYSYTESHAFGEYSHDQESHERTCSLCGFKETESHAFGEYSRDEESHEHTCAVCGFKETESHTFGEYSHDGESHERTCAVCGLKEAGVHAFTYTPTDVLTHSASCICGYSFNEAHSCPTVGETESKFHCSLCGKTYFSALKGSLENGRLRSEYVDGSEEIFKNENNENQTALIPNDENNASLSFKTKSPIIAKGFQIKQKAQEVNLLPESITLYGKNTGDNGYTKIETVAYKSIFGTETADGAYTFLFSEKSDFTAYDDYMAQFSFGDGGNAEKPFQICFFGLISDAPINSKIYFKLDGVVAADAPDKLYPGEDYYASFISRNGYPKDDEKFVLRTELYNVLQNPSTWQYSQDTGILKIMKSFITDGASYTVEITDNDKYVDVDFRSETLSITGGRAVFGKDYETDFKVNSGIAEYAPLDISDITVTDEELREITAFCSLDENGILHIPSKYIKGNKICIFAEEAGRVKRPDKDYKVLLTQNGVNRYFMDIASVKSILELDYPTTLNLIFGDMSADEMPAEPISPKNRLQLSLNEYSLEITEPIFRINNENAYVLIDNGTIKSVGADANTVAEAESGVLVLADVKTEGYNNAVSKVYAKNGGKIIAMGRNSSVNIVLESGGALELSNGVIETLELNSSDVNVKFCYGTVKAANAVSKTDWLSMLADGYVYVLNDVKSFEALANGEPSLGQFSVNEAESTVITQPQDITVKYKNASELKAQGGDGSLYRWVCSDGSIAEPESLTQPVLKIKDTAQVGEYTVYCVIMTGGNVSKSQNVTVTVKCDHEKVDESGTCEICGRQQTVMTENGGTVLYYDDIYQAAEYANSNANTLIKLFDDITVSGKKASDDPEFEFKKATVELKSSGTVLDMNGKTFKIEYENTHIELTGTLTILGNGIFETQIDVINNGRLTVESGTFKRLWVNTKGGVALNGGVFTEISSGGNGELYSDYLGEGKAYIGALDGKFNTSNYENKDFGSISDVEVVDAPFVIKGVTQNKYLEVGAQNEKVSVDVLKNKAYDGEISYMWIAATRTPDSEMEFDNITEVGNTAVVDVDTTGLEGGVHRVYQCIVSYEGYKISSGFVVFTVGKGKPVCDWENYNYIDAKGNDCVVIAAAYIDDKFVGLAYINLTKESDVITYMDESLLIPLGEAVPEEQVTYVNKIKVFFLDGFTNMTPLSDVAAFDL